MKEYEKSMIQMSELLKERKVCLHSRKAHEKCYSEFREYLIKNNKLYSLNESRNWLKEVIKTQYSTQEFHVRWHYMDQLDELIRTGTVLQEHLLLIKPSYEKLSDSWRVLLDAYLLECEDLYTPRTLQLIKIHCSGFILFFQDNGIQSIEEVSCENICDYYKQDLPVSGDERNVILGDARHFLQYCVTKKKCKPVIPLLLEEDIFKYSGDDIQIQLENSQKKSADFSCCAQNVYDSIVQFVHGFEELGYKNTVKKNTSHIIKCLYAFLEYHKLDYSPMVAQNWYECIKPMIGASYRTWSRILKMYERFIQNQELNFVQKYTYHVDRTAWYPQWCLSAIEKYLEWLKKSFHSDGTIRSYKYDVYDFCEYLLSYGICCFNEIDRECIHSYLVQDKHLSVRGRATRNTVLRQFTSFLEDYDYLEDKTLHHVFPLKVAQTKRIVTILSDEQMVGINVFRTRCSSPIEYRDAAMVMTGLRLGFRSSDVINLKLSDIDWINKKVTILQYKTKSILTLPLGNDVGNAIYRYLRFGRPKSDSSYIFIRHKAPYTKVSGKICSNALDRILAKSGFEEHLKFHSLRKTFATNILRNNAGIELVIDALGHRDPTTVDKYLTFDEVHMKKCSLSLKELSIEGRDI